MKKPICVILEGVGGVGKTTVANYIHKQLTKWGQKCYTHHFMSPKGNNPMQKVGYQQGQFELMFKDVEFMLNNGISVILDRSHIGEWIWSKLYRNYDPTYLDDLERQYAHLNIVVIHLTYANPENVLNRLKMRNANWRNDDPFFTMLMFEHLSDGGKLNYIDTMFREARYTTLFSSEALYTDKSATFDHHIKHRINRILKEYR
jgi:thymidylate kinase